MAAHQFTEMNLDRLKELKDLSKSKNTTKSTQNWISILHKWCELRGYKKEIYCYDPKELDGILQRFYGELKKRDGGDYEPQCLRVMSAAIPVTIV